MSLAVTDCVPSDNQPPRILEAETRIRRLAFAPTPTADVALSSNVVSWRDGLAPQAATQVKAPATRSPAWRRVATGAARARALPPVTCGSACGADTDVFASLPADGRRRVPVEGM